MQSPGSLPHIPPHAEHKDHTAAPPGPHFKDQEAAGNKRPGPQSLKPSLYFMPISSSPAPGSALRKRAVPQVRQAVPWGDPGACPLLGDSAANQAGYAWHWPLSLTPAIPHPAPCNHTGSHLLWQTASLKLLTPVVLIQGVTRDPSLANRRKEPISLSIHPSSPQSQLVALTSMSIPVVTALS